MITMLEPKHIKLKSVVMEVDKGAPLDQVKREAAAWALAYQVDVEFEFNGVDYVTGWEALIASIKELK